MRVPAALIFLCLAASAVSVHAIVADKGDSPAAERFFDFRTALDFLELSGSEKVKIGENLKAIEEAEAAFHRARIVRETEAVFRKELARDRNLAGLRSEILGLAAAAQEKIDALADEAARQLTDEGRKRFDLLELPRLTDPGRPVFGMYRRPLSGEEGVKVPSPAAEAAAASFLPKVTFAYSHENHPEMKTGCMECHSTQKRSEIEKAFEKGRLSEGRKPDAVQVPTMEQCLACHNERGAVDECELCHPSLARGKSSLSRRFNPFERLKIGIPAPDFSLATAGGKKVKLARFRGNKFVVIRFGSSTHAAFVTQAAPVSALMKKYVKKPVAFVTIYTAEAHPEVIAGEEWLPKSRGGMALRAAACGEALARLGGADRTVWLVDEWPAKVSLLYGGYPGSVFIIDPSGKIAWKSSHSDAAALGTALDEQIEKYRMQ